MNIKVMTKLPLSRRIQENGWWFVPRFKQFLVLITLVKPMDSGPKHPRYTGFIRRFTGSRLHEATTGLLGEEFVWHLLTELRFPANCTNQNVEKYWPLKPTELWRVFHRMLPTQNVRRLEGFSTFSLLHRSIVLLSWCWSGQFLKRFHNNGRWRSIKDF